MTTHEVRIEDETVSCTCGWTVLDMGVKMSIESWAEHWAETVFLPEYNRQLHRLAEDTVEVLFGIEWEPGHTEYLTSEHEANVLFQSADPDAKLVRTINFKEYLDG